MEEFHVIPGSRVDYDPITGRITATPPPGSQPVPPQRTPQAKKEAIRWPLEKVLVDGQKVRLRRNHSWEGVYHASINKIVRGTAQYKSFTDFVNGYNLQTTGKRDRRTHGIQLCELETNGVWAPYKPTP